LQSINVGQYLFITSKIVAGLVFYAAISEKLCDRTVQNNTFLEAPVFHQTLSTSKASYIGRIPSSTSQGRTRIIHIFPLGPYNENEFTVLSPFHTTRVLEIHYYSAKFRVRNLNSGITINI